MPEEKPIFDMDAAFGNKAPEPEPTLDPIPEPEPTPEPAPEPVDEPEPVDIESEITTRFGFSSEEIENTLIEVADLKKKIAEGPNFATDFQKKLFTFVESLGEVEDLNEAARSYLNLATLDVKTMDNKSILREAFLLDNQDMDREKALKHFNRKFDKDYVTDDPDEQDDVDYALERAAKKAAKELEAKQKDLKPEPKKAEVKKDTVTPEIISKSIEKNLESVKKAIKGFDGIVLKAGDKSDADFKFTLNKEQIKDVEERLAWSVGRADLYNEKGEFTLGFEAEPSRDSLVRAIYGAEILEAFGKHMENVGYERRVSELSGKEPIRSGGTGSKNAPATMDEAWEQLAAERKARKNK